MARGARLLICASGCAAVVAAVLVPSVASGERGTSGSAQVVPQRIVFPAAEPASPVSPAERAVTSRAQPIRAELAGTEATTRACADGSGAETKLNLLENSAVWGHCGAR